MYHSRRYIKEKWNKLKWDIEKTLMVLDEDVEDGILQADVDRVKDEVKHYCQCIIDELTKGD